jgi:putative NADH-flavin reductase
MQVTVFGANGKVGRKVVDRLLRDGHRVVAFIHNHSSLGDHQNLTLVRGDVHHGDDISQAIAGSDAVISALGSWHTPDKNILSSAMERLIPAMRAAGIQKIISLTGAGAFAPQDSPNIFETTGHVFLNAMAPKVLRDSEEHIRLLSESGLIWTVVRAPIMTEAGSHNYKLGSHVPLPWATIHREAVVDCLVQLLDNTSHQGSAPFINRR